MKKEKIIVPGYSIILIEFGDLETDLIWSYCDQIQNKCPTSIVLPYKTGDIKSISVLRRIE